MGTWWGDIQWHFMKRPPGPGRGPLVSGSFTASDTVMLLA